MKSNLDTVSRQRVQQPALWMQATSPAAGDDDDMPELWNPDEPGDPPHPSTWPKDDGLPELWNPDEDERLHPKPSQSPAAVHTSVTPASPYGIDEIDVKQAENVCSTSVTEESYPTSVTQTRVTEAIAWQDIEAIAKRCRPRPSKSDREQKPGTYWRRSFFRLVRHTANLNDEQARYAIHAWHRLAAVPNLTVEFLTEEYWSARAKMRCKPELDLQKTLDNLPAEIPQWLVDEFPDSAELQIFAQFCLALWEQTWVRGNFFASRLDVGEVFGKYAMWAQRKFDALVGKEFIEVTEPGGPHNQKATRYRPTTRILAAIAANKRKGSVLG